MTMSLQNVDNLGFPQLLVICSFQLYFNLYNIHILFVEVVPPSICCFLSSEVTCCFPQLLLPVLWVFSFLMMYPQISSCVFLNGTVVLVLKAIALSLGKQLWQKRKRILSYVKARAYKKLMMRLVPQSSHVFSNIVQIQLCRGPNVNIERYRTRMGKGIK